MRTIARRLTLLVPLLLLPLLPLSLPGCTQLVSRPPTPDQAQGMRLYREATTRPAVGTLTDAEIQHIITDNAALDGQADGLVFAVVDEHGVRLFPAGTLGANDSRKVDGDSLFKIGSITKVFTAILLQDMVDRGEMKLDDPVQKYLPPAAKMPIRNGRQITLFDLATHTSGLPRDSGAGGTPEQLYGFLSSLQLSRDPGSQYEYSNLGVGLLGHVISLKAGKPWETLVVERICNPLHMDSTRSTLTPAMRERAARGHAFPGRPVNDGEWHGPLEGCGALYSSANDLAKFVAANAGITPSPLTPLLQRTYAVHKIPSGRECRLVWMDDGPIILHGGNTNGFSSDIAFDPSRRRGIVSLANCTSCRIRFVWKPILNGQSPRPPQVIALDPALLDRYVGLYQRRNGYACVIRRDGNRVVFQWWVGPVWHALPCVRSEGFPLSDSVFYNQCWSGPVRFDLDPAGRPRSFTLEAPSASDTWTRVASEPPAPTPPRIDPAEYQRYVGQYRLTLFGMIPVGPKLNAYTTTDALGTHLIGYQSDGAHVELFPGGDDTFIASGVDQIWVTASRRLTESGKASAIYVHTPDGEYRAKRVSDIPETPP